MRKITTFILLGLLACGLSIWLGIFGGAAEVVYASATSSGAAAADTDHAAIAATTASTISLPYLAARQAGASGIVLDGDTIRYDGSGAIVQGSTITITAAGTYTVTGTLNDGQIVVDTADDGAVQLVLDGADITCTTSAPIYVRDADAVVLDLAAGSANFVADGTTYLYPDAATDEPNAAIFSHDDLVIQGDGVLTVAANYNNGIASKDALTILAGDITVDAKNDGIKGKDSITVADGRLTVVAGGDGLQSTNADEADQGYIAITNGAFDITAATDGIQAETDLTIGGGTFAIVTGSGSSSTAVDTAKGLKAGRALTITGGTVAVDAADDAVHANGTIAIAGGTLELATADDGIHADSSITIGGGVIDIVESYEGIESSQMTVDGGAIHLASSDDGINVAGDSFNASSNRLSIDGGHLVVDAGGDGLDVNGSISMTDGVVVVNGPTADFNGAIDYDGSFVMTGGFLVAAGSSGMAQVPGTTSTQPSVLIYLPATQAAGTLVRIERADGEELVTFAPTKAYASLAFSSPELEMGASYVVFTGGTSTGTPTDGLYASGVYTGGTQVATFTVNSYVTTVGSGGRPGPGPRGGGPQP